MTRTSPPTLRVLLVEDASDDALLLLRHLRRAGHRPHWRRVETLDALERALDQEGPWDLVLCDYNLPRLDGLQALACVRRHDPDLPFIVVSGVIGEETAVEAMRAGAHDYVMKDNLTRLLPAIERELHEAAQRRAKRLIEADLRLAEEVFRGSQEGILVTDAEARILRVNPAFTRITGYLPEEALGKTPRILRSGRHDRRFYAELWQALLERGYWQGEIWNRRKNGEIYPQWLSISALRDAHGEPLRYVALFTDLSEKKDLEARLRHLADYDPLTELPNRALFQEHVRQRILQGGPFRLYYLGLSGFARVNTSLGHRLGDRILRLVAQRLRQTVGHDEPVARMGGDEFAFLSATSIEEALERAFTAPFLVEGKEIFLNPVLGSAAFPDDAQSSEALIQRAHAAFHSARQSGLHHQPYEHGTFHRIERRLSLDAALRRAFRQQAFRLHFQPQIELESGRLVGAEVLLRWPAGERLSDPALFIPVMEENGLILAVGRWVLEAAWEQYRAWRAAGFAPPRLAVNLSPRQFHDPRLLPHLRRLGAGERWLELEITESSLMEDIHGTEAILRELRQLGIRVAVDDFGTGYSSLSHLKRLPIDTLKIDRTFVGDLERQAEDRAIVATILALGRNLRLHTLAEGIETPGQRDWLRRHGCTLGQGHLLGRPLCAGEFARVHLAPLGVPDSA